ncbi:MAG: hypothetical protein ABI443_00785 [Chthoniobacterales bacterium]
MWSEDNFQYAIENTRVIREPQKRIETFGSTSFRFLLVTELLDYADRVCVRDGRIEAERPRLVSPHHFQKLMLDGFGEDAQHYAEALEKHGAAIKILRYGFQFKKRDISEHLVHEPKQAVIDKLTRELESNNDPMSALIEGVDEAWEVCLLKFTFDLIQRSAGENVDEWKRRGLIQ